MSPRRSLPSLSSRHPIAWGAWVVAAQLGGGSLACVSHPPPPPPPQSGPPAQRPAAAGEAPCAEVWGAFHGGNARSVPLQLRCRLAAALVSAALDTVDRARTGWMQIETPSLEAVVLLGQEQRAGSLLIAFDESCPKVQVSRATGATSEAEVLGRVDRPTRPALALRLERPGAGQDACKARFTWLLGDKIGEMRPPERVLDGQTRVHLAPVISLGLLQPTLVVEVEATGADEFVVTRRAIEVDGPAAFTTSSPSSPPRQ